MIFLFFNHPSMNLLLVSTRVFRYELGGQENPDSLEKPAAFFQISLKPIYGMVDAGGRRQCQPASYEGALVEGAISPIFGERCSESIAKKITKPSQKRISHIENSVDRLIIHPAKPKSIV